METVKMKFLLCGMSSAVAETVTFPFDLTKTRLQIQGEMATTTVGTVRKGTIGMGWKVISEEGLLKLWSGLSPAILRQFIYTGIRMQTYEQIRTVYKRKSDGKFPLVPSIVAGVVSGSFGQLIATPFDLAKVIMQTRLSRSHCGCKRLQLSPHSILKEIYVTRGPKALWTGCLPSVGRAGLVNIGNLSVYDLAKQSLLKNGIVAGDNLLCHTFASFCAGLAATLLSTPADVVKTRMMNQQGVNKAFYKSSLDCLFKTIKHEGPFSLYKGFFPIWLRIGPWSMLFWITIESTRSLLGMKGF